MTGIPPWLQRPDDDDWYGTDDHQAYENMIEQAAGATWQDGPEEPPAGTFVPGLGEI